MSDLAPEFLEQSRRLAGKWGWFVVLGLLMIAAGVFALGETVMVTLVSVLVIGALLIVAGVVQLVHAFGNRDWRSSLFGAVCGALYVVGGFLIMMEPVRGSLVITVFLIAALAVGGILRIVLALRHRDVHGWWLLMLGGVISLTLAAMLFASLPWSGLWVLGMLIGIELLVQGFTWTSFGFALRALR